MEIIAVFYGMIIGSFSVSEPGNIHRSQCAFCKTSLLPWDLIPLFSYFSLRGKCRYCGEKIAPLFPIAEGAFGLISGIIYLKNSDIFLSAWLVALAGFSFRIIHGDLKEQNLYIADLIGLLTLRILAIPLVGKIPIEIIITAVLLGGSLFLFAKKTGMMGEGDGILLGILISFASTPLEGVYILLRGSIVGAVIAIALLTLTKRKGSDALPFSPFLFIGSIPIFLRWL